MDKSLYERLMQNSVISGDCIVWLGYANSTGYGLIRQQGKQDYIHRLVYEATTGEIADVVRHTCCNRRCWNPNHLLGGSQRDNVQDSIRAGTHYPTATAKVTEEEVRKIIDSDLSHAELAAKYGLSRSHIANIKSGVRWRHIW